MEGGQRLYNDIERKRPIDDDDNYYFLENSKNQDITIKQ